MDMKDMPMSGKARSLLYPAQKGRMAPVGKPKISQLGPDDERLVREGRLEVVLEAFYDEVGQRSAELLKQYHSLMVAPLALRVAYLEMSWWQRRRLDMRAVGEAVRAWWKAEHVTVPVPEKAPASESGAAAEPESEGV